VADRNYLFDPNNRLNPASAYPAFAAQEQQPLVWKTRPVSASAPIPSTALPAAPL